MKPSLSIFFPCYNDKGTIGTLVWEANSVAARRFAVRVPGLEGRTK